jgi:hypothetical protein
MSRCQCRFCLARAGGLYPVLVAMKATLQRMINSVSCSLEGLVWHSCVWQVHKFQLSVRLFEDFELYKESLADYCWCNVNSNNFVICQFGRRVRRGASPWAWTRRRGRGASRLINAFPGKLHARIMHASLNCCAPDHSHAQQCSWYVLLRAVACPRQRRTSAVAFWTSNVCCPCCRTRGTRTCMAAPRFCSDVHSADEFIQLVDEGERALQGQSCMHPGDVRVCFRRVTASGNVVKW